MAAAVVDADQKVDFEAAGILGSLDVYPVADIQPNLVHQSVVGHDVTPLVSYVVGDIDRLPRTNQLGRDIYIGLKRAALVYDPNRH
jgi:hypothetical protein